MNVELWKPASLVLRRFKDNSRFPLERERERERERIDRAELFNQVSPLIKEGTVPLSIEQPREYKWRERE